MPPANQTDLAFARAALHQILDDPPMDWDALEQRVQHLAPSAARQVLLEWFQGPDFEEHFQPLFLALAELFDLEITPELQESLTRNSQAAFMGSMVEDPDAPTKLADAMAHTAADQNPEALQRLDRDRRAFMVPAWQIYGPSLAREELASLHAFMVEAITAEAAGTNLDIWDHLWGLKPVEPARTLLQKALMQSRTASIPGQKTRQPGPTHAETTPAPVRAFFSECDGLGAFTMLLEVGLPNGNVHLHNVVLRLDGELRDGFTMGNREPDALADMMDTYLAVEAIGFTPLPLTQAAEWARTALADADADIETRHAAANLIWAAGMGQPLATEPEPRSLDEPVSPVPDPAEQEIFGLFMDTHLSWFLNGEQLAELGIDTTTLAAADSTGQEEALARIDQPRVRAHLQSLMRHMSLYRRYAGTDGGVLPEPAFYDHMASLLEDPESGLRVMVPYFSNSLAAFLANPDGVQLPFGDAQRRDRLREVCFWRLSRPKGKHMAYLDFSEVAHHALETIAALKGEDYRQEEAYAHHAVAMGKAFVDAFFELGDGRRLPENDRRYQRMLNAMVKHGGWDLDRAEGLWVWVADKMAEFQDEVCDYCAVDCLERPTGNLEDWFFSEVHPGAVRYPDD